jgi:hypothetical protein
MIARRHFLLAVVASPVCFGQVKAESILSGRLVQSGNPAFLTSDGKTVTVSGDDPTNKILNDSRLNGRGFEAKGHAQGAGSFTIDPIETRPMVVFDGARRLRVTYYCDVCSIRTYSPGPCMCCQAETRLDLIDPSAKE